MLEQAYKTAIEGLEKSIKSVEKLIKKLISDQDSLQKSYDLLLSIPGIGNITAIYLIVCTNNFAGNIAGKHPLRLLDLCIKFFQDFVTWKVSQNERFAARRKPEPVESTLPSAAELETHGPIQGSTGYYSQDSCGKPPDRNLGKTHARVMNVNSFSGLQFYKI